MNVTIIGKPNCGYCAKAKILLDIKGIKYKYYTIDPVDAIKNGYEQMAAEDVKTFFPNVSTVPIIVVDGVFIGGYTELDAMLRDLGDKKLLLG